LESGLLLLWLLLWGSPFHLAVVSNGSVTLQLDA
jgi:hypothetical protein